MDAARFERFERFFHRHGGRAEIERAELGRLARRALFGLRHEALGGLELVQQALHVVDVVVALFAIARVAVLAGAAGEEGAALRMRAGQRAVGDAVAVDIEVAAELDPGLELLVGHHLAAVVSARRIPVQRRDQPVVHADVEIEHDEDRRLQPVGEVERVGGHGEGLVRVLGEDQHVLGVAVRGIGAGQDVGLLGAGRHAGRRAAALDVEDDRRDFGEIGEADEFLHQRDAGARGRGEGARAVPAGADRPCRSRPVRPRPGRSRICASCRRRSRR